MLKWALNSKHIYPCFLSDSLPLLLQMDTMHSMLARYSRGETASVSILARAHDMRYEAQVNKLSARDHGTLDPLSPVC